MSETVHYVGKLQIVEKLENETLEEICKRILNKHNYFDLKSYFDSWQEMLYDELYEKYVVVNDNVFEVLTKIDKGNEYDIFNIEVNNDKTYNYEVMYYNGGCGFNEAIEEAFNKLND